MDNIRIADKSNAVHFLIDHFIDYPPIMQILNCRDCAENIFFIINKLTKESNKNYQFAYFRIYIAFFYLVWYIQNVYLVFAKKRLSEGSRVVRKLTKLEVKSKLYTGVEKVVAQSGIEKLTTRKVAEACNLSEPYIYQIYGGIGDLLEDRFLAIDQEIAELVNSAIQNIEFKQQDENEFQTKCWILWDLFWKYLMENADRTIFYWRFYQSAAYTLEIVGKRTVYYQAFMNYAQSLFETCCSFDNTDSQILIANMIDNTVMMAIKLLIGEYQENENTVQTIFYSVFASIFSLFEV